MAFIRSMVLAVAVIGFSSALPLNPALQNLNQELADLTVDQNDVLERADAFAFESIKGFPTAADLQAVDNNEVPQELQATIRNLEEVTANLGKGISVSDDFNEAEVKANLRSDDIVWTGALPAGASLAH